MRNLAGQRGLVLAALFAAACSGSAGENVQKTDGAVASGTIYNLGTLANPGSCMDARWAGTSDGTQIQEWTCNGTAAQSFEVVDAGGGVVNLVNTNANKCVDVADAGTDNGTQIRLWDCNGTKAQTFLVQNAGGGSVTFVNTNSGKCLDVQGDNPANGTVVQLYDCNGTHAQIWSLTAIGAVSSGGSSPDAGGGTTSGGSGADAGTGGMGGSGADSGGGGLDVPPAATRGATAPYWEYEAEDSSVATTNGAVLHPNLAEGQLTAEASGRSVVELTTSGQYVSFTLQHRANSIVVRYSIPDAPGGGGMNATLGLYLNGTRRDLNLTSRYMYSYGSLATLDGSPSIATKNPSAGLAHHFFDEVHALFPQELPVGAVVKLQVDAQDTAGRYDIDLVDFEDVAPPLAQPAGSISITDAPYGAVAGATDAATAANNQTAINAAIAAATVQNKVLWIPAGVFTLAPQPANLQNVNYNQVPKLFVTGSVSVQGAGMWYSVLQGFGAQFELKGNPETQAAGAPPTPLAVTYHFSDFALFGDVTWRQDTNSGWQGFDGPWGTGSTLTNVWIEHENAGIWGGSGWDFPTPLTSALTQGLKIHGARVRDLYADGINLNSGTSGSTIEQTHVRNAGDDSLVLWSFSSAGSVPCANNVIQYNSVQTVWKANCFALYGGASNSFQNNTCADTANMAGMLVATDFTPIPLSGMNTILHNTLTRAGGVHGSDDYAGEGALMFFLGTQPISNVEVQDMLVDTPILAGIQFSGGNSVSNLRLSGITIQSYGALGPVVENGTTYGSEGIMIEGGVSGSAECDNVVIGAGNSALVNDDGTAFTIVRGSGNSGW